MKFKEYFILNERRTPPGFTPGTTVSPEPAPSPAPADATGGNGDENGTSTTGAGGSTSTPNIDILRGKIQDFIKTELDKFTAEREEYEKLRSGIESGGIEGIITGQLAAGFGRAREKARGVENTPLISKFLARTSKNLSSLKYNDSPKADLGQPTPYRPRVKTKDFYK